MSFITRNSARPRGIFFVVNTSSTSGNYVLSLPTDLKASSFNLMAYSIRGVPVTGGVPNDLYFNLEFQGGNDNLARNDGLVGWPLQLTGSFTSQKYEGEGLVISDTNKASYASIYLKITDPLGRPAIFGSLALWINIGC